MSLNKKKVINTIVIIAVSLLLQVLLFSCQSVLAVADATNMLLP